MNGQLFCDTLKFFRIKNEFTQEYMSEKLEISRGAYSSYETGRSSPNIETIIRICEIMHVTPNALFDYRGR